MSGWVIFTDLDGTLLDHRTYSWDGARTALARTGELGIPVVLSTSKTRAEVEPLRRELGNPHPFITENGAGLFIPEGYFAFPIEEAAPRGAYLCLPFGRPYEEVVSALLAISAASGVAVRGFHQMDAREIADRTGLSIEQAQLARQREWDEPFVFAGSEAEGAGRFSHQAVERGFELARGGRFWHLFAGGDKGKAAQKLAAFYERRESTRTIGLGDAANDLPLLRAVDVPVILPGPDGAWDTALTGELTGALRAPLPGPRGWNEAVLRILA
jgi:mannosyl-3-phosphoglycerate phosphatase